MAMTARILAVVVALLNGFMATAQITNFVEINGAKSGKAKVKTVFQKNGELTETEIAQVISLAKQSGITNPAEVRIFRFLPTGGRGIAVKGAELHEGRNTRFDTIYIYKVGWSNMETNLQTKLMGKFWADNEGKVPKLLRSYQSKSGKSFQVSISQDTDVALADAMVDSFTADKLQFFENEDENKMFRQRLEKRGNTMPKSIHKQHAGSEYEMELDDYPTTVIKFKFENGKIIVTGVLIVTGVSEYVV